MDNLTTKELLEIESKLKRWEWDDRLGYKPLGFDEMPNRDRESLFCKYKVLKPYMEEIEKRTSEKQRLRYHHLNNLKRNRLQFEIWWIKRFWRFKILKHPF